MQLSVRVLRILI